MESHTLGEVYAFTAIDTYSRQTAVLIQPGLTSQDGKAALDYAAQVFGKMRVIQTDGGSEFEKEFAQAVGHYADKHVVARPYKKND